MYLHKFPPTTSFLPINSLLCCRRGWATVFVNALKSLDDAIGVVGPRCRQGNQVILTHDFVNRVHMKIFNKSYYPPMLTDWWSDDWISSVYGESRTMKASKIEVIHHTMDQKRRYEVNESLSSRVKGLISEGQAAVNKWMAEKISVETAIAYEKNVKKGVTFSIKDIPESVYEMSAPDIPLQ